MRLVFERQHRNRWPSAVRYSEETNSFYPESPSARRDADERSILWKGYQSAWQHRQQELDAARLDVERLRLSLEELACLGNGDRYGNSIGNEIAIKALAAQQENG